jgi:hypothetical protein
LDEAELERLVELGVRALLPVERLRTVADYCWDRGETTGDARYCSLSKTFGYIVKLLEDYGAIEARTLDSVDRALQRDLGAVLAADTAEAGALLGRSLREEVLALLGADGVLRGGMT